MKAKVYYKDYNDKRRVKTIEVEQNEPNLIVREFIKVTNLHKSTYVVHIKCGRYDYQWHGVASGAGIY